MKVLLALILLLGLSSCAWKSDLIKAENTHSVNVKSLKDTNDSLKIINRNNEDRYFRNVFHLKNKNKLLTKSNDSLTKINVSLKVDIGVLSDSLKYMVLDSSLIKE